MELLCPENVRLVSVPLPFQGEGELPVSLKEAHPARKEKFLAGRHCARLALGSNAPLRILEDGAPEWPVDFVGSITHTDGIAAAVVAPSSLYQGLGLDIEPFMNQKTFDRVQRRILLGSELAPPEGWDPLLWSTLIFSGKESIYKALRPLSGKYFGFEAAELRLINHHRFSFILKSDIGGGLNMGLTGEGRFEIKDGRVWTLVAY